MNRKRSHVLELYTQVFVVRKNLNTVEGFVFDLLAMIPSNDQDAALVVIDFEVQFFAGLAKVS